MAQSDPQGLKILQTAVVAQDDWLRFLSRSFLGSDGKTHGWSYVERRQNRRAVVIIARTETNGSIILIRQFRIPLAAWIYEFPAGLVDEGEALATAALRELREETGYAGDVLSVSPALPTSAGLSSEYIHLVHVRCADLPGAPNREAAEAIEIELVEDNPMAIRLFLAKAEEQGIAVDAKLYSWLQGRIAL